jgi:DNA-entry nuclease
MNIEGQLPFEEMVADYIKKTGNHVLYRVTPVFEGDNLLAAGVLMEAISIEDGGEGILFNVFCYNVQPGVEIDYATGDNWESGTEQAVITAVATQTPIAKDTDAPTPKAIITETKTNEENDYVLNTNTKKFHKPGCSSVRQMNESNKQEYHGTRDDVIAKGYSPCGRCNP